MPINRLLKDKRTPEEIELLNKAFHHALNLLGVVDRNDPLCDMIWLSRSARPALASRERLRRWPWFGLAYGKAVLPGAVAATSLRRFHKLRMRRKTQ